MAMKMTRRRVLQGGASTAVLGAAACGSGSEPDPPRLRGTCTDGWESSR
jgi:hypothetical protein